MCKRPEPNAKSKTPVDRLGAALDMVVVVPSLNDGPNLARLLPQLHSLGLTVVVSDGGSTDNSVELVLEADVHLVVGRANRGEQLARGIAATTSDWILLLHADGALTVSALQQLAEVMRSSDPVWGCFDIMLEPQSPGLRCISWFMNHRSRLTKICTGDQGMFLHRSLLDAVGGFPCQPLMEDIELSNRLRLHHAPFLRLPGPLLSSARRWQTRGLVRTVLSMWRFRLRYWLGASPAVLAEEYYAKPQDSKAKSGPSLI